MTEYGALIKSAREQQGMTQDDLGRRMGRPHTFVVRMENARNANPPEPETMRQIWRILGISLRSQLVAIGYLDPDEPEPGVAYVIREDDPRAALLAAVEGMADHHLAAITDLVVLSTRLTNGRDREEGGQDQSGVA